VPAQSKRQDWHVTATTRRGGEGQKERKKKIQASSASPRGASRRGTARRIMRPNETNEVKHSKPTARATSAIRFLIIVINSTGTEAGGCAALLEGERIAARRAVIFPLSLFSAETCGTICYRFRNFPPDNRER